MAEMITVSALNRYVRSLLEENIHLSDIAIKGEISNFNRHFKTGHCYFSLKDADSSLKAVMFRSNANELAFQPENGMSVIARGRVSLFERDGAFQLYVDALFLEGTGLVQLAFEQLKARLEREGLFASEHKKPIPSFPDTVGLITSKTGAALQDILNVARRRCPSAKFVLASVRVQGADAAAEIAHAVEKLDETGAADVIIIARGGGSAEDLSVFNDETIARAVFNCITPVISAIGHEVDFTILDFVADLRAPTPSAAAELALPNLSDQIHAANIIFNNIQRNMHKRLELCYNELVRQKNHTALREAAQRSSQQQRRLHDISTGIANWQKNRLGAQKNRLVAAIALAASLNPYAVLARGYAVPLIDNTPFKSVKAVEPGQILSLKMQDGVIHSVIRSVEESPKETL